MKGPSETPSCAGPRCAWLGRIEPWSALVLMLLPLVWGTIVFAPEFNCDPDGYFHVGVAQRILTDGWLSNFPWLPHTTLHSPFPDMYLGTHLLLAPLVGLFGPEMALRVGILLLSGLSALSTWAVLRRRKVPFAGPWVTLWLLASPLVLTYAVFLKGAAGFFVILPWFVDAVWQTDSPEADTSPPAGWRRLLGGHWRVFFIAWLSVYIYVGATVLVAFAVVHTAVAWVWGGRLSLRLVGATVGGILCGMLANPAWPAHWAYVGRELLSFLVYDPTLVPGEFRGGEWAAVDGSFIVKVAWPGLVMVFGYLLLQTRFAAPSLPRSAVSGLVMTIAFLGAGFMSGTKLLMMGLVFGAMTFPHLFHAWWAALPRETPRRGVFRTLVVAGLVLGGVGSWKAIQTVTSEQAIDGTTRPADYRLMGAWLRENAAPNEMVVAAWDDMPGFFLFGGEQRYMAGFNAQFLRDGDQVRFNAYVFFFRGLVADPEVTMVQMFDGARFVIVRRDVRSPGEDALARRLTDRKEHFEELASPAGRWRIFRRRPLSGEGLP